MDTKKEVVIITISPAVGEFYKELLYELFGGLLHIDTYSVERDVFTQMRTADLYLVATTSSDIFGYVMSLVPERKKAVVVGITMTKKHLEVLNKLPRGTEAMLVNLSANMAIETISDLNRLGITHIKFFPVYPEIEQVPRLDLAITTGESRFVPRFVKKTIDLGHRVFTASTIVEIALKLDFPWFLESAAWRKYLDALAEQDYSVDTLAEKTMRMENKFEILMEAMDVGVIGVDVCGKVFAFNSPAADMTGLSRTEAVGRAVESIPLLCGQAAEEDGKRKVTRLIQWKDSYFNFSTAPIVSQKRYLGCFFIIQRFSDAENQQNSLRLQLLNKGHTTKYTFDDIIGECPAMVKAKNIARKMAKTDASILLTGESGTGKELFAHSIHNSSLRSGMPFVAINCAALPESLLESELFGYAEGAFTGAKKGGKLGLFEYAHRGTLFLDEIEGMSANLQVKLLRVLQEKEVMRLGENKIISIDVRIIAASNENIREMVKKGAFRKDLYYRLNTLPIDIPPLRERGRDIFLLMEQIKKQAGAAFSLTEDAAEAFQRYYWDGNVRELRNIVEYLKFMDLPVISYCDLPEVLRENSGPPCKKQPSLPTERLLHMMDGREEEYRTVLASLYSARQNGRLIGRKSISLFAQERRVQLSEQEIRTILRNLSEFGLVSIAKGRGGSKLTPKGEEFYLSLQ